MPPYDLSADCDNCAAVCCIALVFDRSEDFAIDKAANVACPQLTADCRCAIHAERLARGFSGCVTYQCYGAGPSVTRAFAGEMERDAERNQAFLVLRVVHELLWQLTEAAKLVPSSRADVAAEVRRAITGLDAIARAPAQSLPERELRAHENAARAALLHVGDALGGRRPAIRVLPVLPQPAATCARAAVTR